MKIMHKIAAIIALLIGIMSVISGSMVLLNYNMPNYNVLNWLVVYNVILGGISIVAAILIWKNNKSARKIILAILISHLLVFLYLYFLSQEVALESIKAMGFRVSVWMVIFLLTYKKVNN
ncbi:MAG: hypothetical protein ACYCZ2_05770 [Lutibacter sp.]|nr:MAG: hypothetical protein APF83_02635 [Lutibacter sp. BRH_c52]HCE55726.1 hypothetical protein [Lutibacter sp.]